MSGVSAKPQSWRITVSVRRCAVLKPGDLVRLVSPASYPDKAYLDRYITTLVGIGLRCDAGEHVLSQYGYMAGTDDERLSDLNDALRDPDVRAIITTRGGAGAYRIADQIDVGALRADPKPILGFSDITSLHLAVLQQAGVGGLHGCLVGDQAIASARQCLMSTNPIVLSRVSDAVTAEIHRSGTATGPLIGGNLQMVATSVGVRLPLLNGAILFLEYHRMGLGTIDRYLTQLIESGSLNGLAGLALGSFECGRYHEDRGWTVHDVLNDRLGTLEIPILGGLFAGHDLVDGVGRSDQITFPLGPMARMDADLGVLEIQSLMQ